MVARSGRGIITSDCPWARVAMNLHDGGDAAQRLRCTHLSFDYARGKYPERVPEDHTISEGVTSFRVAPSAQGVKGEGRANFRTSELPGN